MKFKMFILFLMFNLNGHATSAMYKWVYIEGIEWYTTALFLTNQLPYCHINVTEWNSY